MKLGPLPSGLPHLPHPQALRRPNAPGMYGSWGFLSARVSHPPLNAHCNVPRSFTVGDLARLGGPSWHATGHVIAGLLGKKVSMAGGGCYFQILSDTINSKYSVRYDLTTRNDHCSPHMFHCCSLNAVCTNIMTLTTKSIQQHLVHPHLPKNKGQVRAWRPDR